MEFSSFLSRRLTTPPSLSLSAVPFPPAHLSSLGSAVPLAAYVTYFFSFLERGFRNAASFRADNEEDFIGKR